MLELLENTVIFWEFLSLRKYGNSMKIVHFMEPMRSNFLFESHLENSRQKFAFHHSLYTPSTARPRLVHMMGPEKNRTN